MERTGDRPVTVRSFVDEGLGHSSYLLAVAGADAVVVDPPRFTADHEHAAAAAGAALAVVAETHSHADYVTGGPSLAARSGADLVAPAASRLASRHVPVREGDRVTLGPATDLVALATPGHTPDHHAYLVERAGRPVALFSGGSLLVGTVGRTDLDGEDHTLQLARAMFRSLRRFEVLPDDLDVYPTHGAGSFCSAPGSSARTTTLGAERQHNQLFRIASEDEFVTTLLDGFGSFPPFFLRLPETNRLGPDGGDRPPPLARLDLAAFDRAVAEGAVVVDVRGIGDFAAGHVPGALSNALRPSFSNWIGWLTEPDRPLVFVLDQDQDRSALVRQCLDVGVEGLVGELDGGMATWEAAGRRLATVPIADPRDLEVPVVDVRQRNEYLAGHVPGATNIELGQLTRDVVEPAAVAVMCGHGERAMSAASLLLAHGRPQVAVVLGGTSAWSRATGRDPVPG